LEKLKLEQLNRVDIETFKSITKTPIVVVLDNVRSMHNVGSVFRTCDAFAVEQIILTGITAQPPHREIEKAALGATESVDWKHIPTTLSAVIELKNKGYSVIAIEQTTQSVDIQQFKPTQEKIALVFGNEVHGVDQEALQACDMAIEIPQFGTKHSFNVSVTAGIVLWDLLCKLK
jgi:23S rRNA (guanosine2251-2'-O)-methyltransferase